MKRILTFAFVLSLMLIISGCRYKPNIADPDDFGNQLNPVFPFPTAEVPEKQLLEYPTLEGTKLNFLYRLYKEVYTGYSSVKRGLIHTKEDYAQSKIDLVLADDFFDDKFMIVTTLAYTNSDRQMNFIDATFNGNHFMMQIEYMPGNLDGYNRSVSKVYMYVFSKDDFDFSVKSTITYQVTPTYKDVYTYIHLYLDVTGIEEDDKPAFYELFLSKYQITEQFYVEKYGHEKIKLRVSNEFVSIDQVEEVLSELLDDPLCLYYAVHNDLHQYAEAKAFYPNAAVSRVSIPASFLYPWGADGYYDSVTVLENYADFEDLIDEYLENNQNYYQYDGLANYLNGLKETYNEVFFSESNLAIFGLIEGSGSIGHFVDDVRIEDDKVIIDLYRLIPGIGTDDMAFHTAYVPVPKGYETVGVKLKNIALYDLDDW